MTAEKRQLKEIDSLINKPEEIYLLQSDQTLHTHTLSLSLSLSNSLYRHSHPKASRPHSPVRPDLQGIADNING